MKAYNNLSLAICLLLSVDSSKAIRQHLKAFDEKDEQLVQNAKDAIAYNNAMLEGKKIVNELPNQPPSSDSDLELDPESPLFFAQSHKDQVRAMQIKEEQSHTVVKTDKDQIDTDYTEQPDGIDMSEQLRSVVSFVQLENDVQIKQENKLSETQKQKVQVKTEAKIENKTQQKTQVKQKTKQDINGKLMLMLGGEDDVAPDAKAEDKTEDKKDESAKPQSDTKDATEAPADDKKAAAEAPAEDKKAATEAPAEDKKAATEAPADDKKAAADAPSEDKKAAAPAESTVDKNFDAEENKDKMAYQKKDDVVTKTPQENKVDTLAETKSEQSPLEKASDEAPKEEAPKTEEPKEVAPKEEAPKVEAPIVEAPKTEAPKDDKKPEIAVKEDKKPEADKPVTESKASEKSGKKEDIDASAFDFTVTDDKSKTDDSKKPDVPAAESKTESLAQAVEAPKAETKIAEPAPAAAAPVKSKASDLIKKLKANAAAKLAKEKSIALSIAKKIVKKTPPPVQEFVKNVQEAAVAIPQDQITTPVQAVISSKSAPKSTFVPFEVPRNLIKEMSPEEKAAKDKLENPTVDENGEHIETVEESKLEAQAMQNMLDEGVANVDKKIEERNMAMAQEDAMHKDEPVKQEEDDGHIETVEEVKAKMKALSDNMNSDLAAVNNRADASQQEQAAMPDMSALTTITGTIHSMGASQAKRQANLLAARLGVALNDGEENLQVSELTATLVARAQKAGKSEQEIQEAISE